MVGTARYMSVNCHLGLEASRRDDLESLAYMLIYFSNGSLPWQGIDSPNKQEKYEKIGDKKMKVPVEVYTRNLPEEFSLFLNYTKSLLFDEKPDYVYIKKLFEDLFIRENFVKDYAYDWTNQDNINIDIVNKKTLPFDYVVDK